MELHITLKEAGDLIGFPMLQGQYEEGTDSPTLVIINLGDRDDTTSAQESFLVKAMYQALNPILGQHRGSLEEMKYYRLVELESEILNTVSYDELAAFIGPSHELMSVAEKTEYRMQLALTDKNMQTLTANSRTVAEVLEEMKRV